MITIPYLTAVSTYFSYGLLFAFGQLRDYSRLIFDWWRTSNLQVNFSIGKRLWRVEALLNVFAFRLGIRADLLGA